MEASEKISQAFSLRSADGSPRLILAAAPFILTFVAVSILAYRTLFPRLSGRPARHDGVPSPSSSRTSVHFVLRQSLAWALASLDRAAAITFSITMALSAVLAELIFCEITNLTDPAVRKTVLEVTTVVLLVSLLIVAPALEIHSLNSALNLFGSGKRRLFLGLILDLAGLAAWLMAFLGLGSVVLQEAQANVVSKTFADHARTFTKTSLERIAIIGVSLMASLAGFAAVSSIWQTFGAKARKVTDVDIARKQHGLDATTDLLHSKESRLRAFERKLGEAPTETLFTRFVGSFRGGNADTLEIQSLELECKGLESMAVSLSNELSVLRARQAAQKAAATPLGRLTIATSYIFSIYCIYRIGATSTATLRRWASPSTSTFATSDPINNFLALVAKHWDPTIDRAAWSRQISFLLSGLMLLASFNAVWQTVLLFSRFVPTALQRPFAENSALLVSQISATYVVSSALLLRSNLPREMSKGIEGALGDPLDTAFVEKWFEGWFLGVVVLTTLGVWIGRKIGGAGDWDDDFIDDANDVELGRKMRMA